MSLAHSFNHAVGWPVADPARYLALGVIAYAVDEARLTRRWGTHVSIDPFWPELAGVPRDWLAAEGIVVAERTAV